MFVTVPQARVLLAAIGLVAAFVVALDLSRFADRPRTVPHPTTYTGIPRNTPGSTAHLRVAYRASLGRGSS